MGACCGSAPSDMTETIDKNDMQSKKVLLLGPGSSGKSTIVKQLKILFGGGFNDKDRRDYKAQIENQVIENMKKLIIRQRELINENPNQYNYLKFENSETESSASYVEQIRTTIEEMNEEIAKHISILWKDRGIRYTFDLRGKLVIPDSTSYFFDNCAQIASKDYMPSDTEILYVNKRTTAPIEDTIQIDNSKYIICDVGGQRNERKKWVHTFENVSILMFVVSLSSYNEMLFEDDTILSMNESLPLFEQIVNSHQFNNNVRFALILNKNDIFEQYLEKVPINKCFPEYNGPNDYDSSITYIKDQFMKRVHNGKERNILTYVINATSRTSVEKLFHDIRSASSRSQTFL